MFWSKLWPMRWFRARLQPARRILSTAKLAIEVLEDRALPSGIVGPVPSAAFEAWRQQTFHVDDQTVTGQATPQNASFGSMIGLPSVFSNYSYRGDNYSVAIIDTGIDYNNPNLGGGFGSGHRVIAGWDFANNDADPMDDNGHGTHVAGIVGSSDATYSGIAPNVNFIALKVLDSKGSGTFGNVQNALDWVVANRAKYNIVAVNLSLGSGNYSSNPYTFLDSDFNALVQGGVFISVAAGNSFYTYNSTPGLDFPAVNPYVVSVGAVYNGNFGSIAWASGARDYTTGPDYIASFSQRGAGLSILAPGALVTSTYLNNTFKSMAGTSMAAPVIAGAAVILHQAMDTNHLTANESTILSLMQKTGVSVIDNRTGAANVTPTGLTFKRIDLSAALSALGKPVNAAPVLQSIASQFVAPGGTRIVTLNATDPNGDSITFSAKVLGAAGSQTYQLQQQLRLTYAGSYYTNIWGQNEKWLSSKSGAWYCLLPTGKLYRWAGSMTATLQASNLIATLDASIYADPSKLWNAQAVAVPTVSIAGNQLTISAPAGATGRCQIQVTASDGSLSSSQTFTLSIQSMTSAPVISGIANQSVTSGQSVGVNLSATDGQNKLITFTAKILGTFATAPATLTISGSRLTINAAPDYVGSYTVQVTASNGALSSSTSFAVIAAASTTIARHVTGDFNGDGLQDLASFHQDGSWWINLRQANGSYLNRKWGTWNPASAWSIINVGDFNGDKKTDIIGLGTNGAWWVGLSSGAGFTTRQFGQWSAPSAYASIQLGDFNGDGRTDILGFTTGGAVWVGTSTGSAFTSNLWTQWSPASSWSNLTASDVDGDGKTDFTGKNANGKWYVAYSNGTAFNTQLWTGSTPPGASKTATMSLRAE